MITIKQAIETTSKDLTYAVNKVIDLGDRWGVCLDSGDPPEPGIPVITVDKETGETDTLSIPPIENISLIDSAPVVWNG